VYFQRLTSEKNWRANCALFPTSWGEGRESSQQREADL
jgi:hypothetical protein